MEDSQRIPDVDVGAGFRSFAESDDQAFVVGLSVPLAFGNRNQGNREAARIRMLQAEDRLSAAQLELYQELLEKSSAVQAAYATVSSLENKQVPIAREAFEQASDGYFFHNPWPPAMANLLVWDVRRLAQGKHSFS